MKDSTLRPELPGEEVTFEEQEEWRVHAVQYLKRGRDDDLKDGEEVVKTKKKARTHRISSYRHVLALDSMLQSAVVGGMSAFLAKDGDNDKSMLDLHTWVNCEDSGQIPWSSRQFLMYSMRLREFPTSGHLPCDLEEFDGWHQLLETEEHAVPCQCWPQSCCGAMARVLLV